MEAASAVSNDNESDRDEVRPAAVLRGTAKGLEIHVHGQASADAIAAAVARRLHEAPTFFRGSDVRVKVDGGPLPAGCLGKLDELAVEFELRIVEVAAVKPPAPARVDGEAVPVPSLAAGSAPSPQPQPFDGQGVPPAVSTAEERCGLIDDEPTVLAARPLEPSPTEDGEPMRLAAAELTALIDRSVVDRGSSVADELPHQPVSFDEPTLTAVPIALAVTAEDELPTAVGTRLVVGPVRSGVILEHEGHLIVFGDVNPGAEIRAEGNIVVLGRLRGTAHAGIGQDVGFILALRLEPQQLRVGRKVARAADSDAPGTEPEIAYCTGDTIVVERYLGKLPRNLATSI